jgi:integrase
MALELSIYNRQDQTSKDGKKYVGRVCVFAPGQSGRLSDADQLPPFYIRDQRGGKQWVRLAARTIADAKTEAQKAQDVMDAERKGVPIVAPNGEQSRLSIRIEEYLREIEANKSVATYKAYSRSLELFKESCRRANLEDVSREDVLAFKVYLKKHDDIGERSAFNNFLNVMIFLKWAGHKVNIKKNDWPPKPERDPDEYTDEEIEAMMKVADENDRLLLKAFLNSGMRDGEMAHFTYGDIDVKHSLWKVRPKAGHTLKTKEAQRRIPVGEWLTKKIMEKKVKESKTDQDLIFPNGQGNPDGHLIRVVQKVAEEAKVTGRVDDHKFRSSAICRWLRAGVTVYDVMGYVGHKSPNTILRYYKKVNLEKKENRDIATKAFDQYASAGD